MLPMVVNGQLWVNLIGLDGGAAAHVTVDVLNALLASVGTPSIFTQIVQSLLG